MKIIKRKLRGPWQIYLRHLSTHFQMAEAGALNLLLVLAASHSDNVCMQAVWAIANLAVNEDIIDKLGQLDAVRILLDALDRAARNDEEQSLVQTTRAIANLAVMSKNRQRVLSHNSGLRLLIKVARSPYVSVQEATARALVNLSYEADVARSIVQAGGIPPITAMLKSSRSQVQQEAIWVIVNLSVLPENEGLLTVPEVLEPLVALLRTANTSVQEQASWALSNVSSNATSKMTIINLGALGALRALNQHRCTPELQAASNKALTSLCQGLTPLSRRVYITEPIDVHGLRGMRKHGRLQTKRRSRLCEIHSSVT